MRILHHLGAMAGLILALCAGTMHGAVRLVLMDGLPVVDGVYVNGHGPYRFLVDTGSNVNLIELALAAECAMGAGFETELGSAAGKTRMRASDANEVSLDGMHAAGQRFLESDLAALHGRAPGVRGVLGQWFLANFDYTLDLHGQRLTFGTQESSGTRTRFRMVNARPVVTTSLGELALDSGQAELVLFGVDADAFDCVQRCTGLRTLAGTQRVHRMQTKQLMIDGRKVRSGDALGLEGRPEPGVDGLLPLGLFRTVYVCNSEGYVVLG